MKCKKRPKLFGMFNRKHDYVPYGTGENSDGYSSVHYKCRYCGKKIVKILDNRDIIKMRFEEENAL